MFVLENLQLDLLFYAHRGDIIPSEPRTAAVKQNAQRNSNEYVRKDGQCCEWRGGNELWSLYSTRELREIIVNAQWFQEVVSTLSWWTLKIESRKSDTEMMLIVQKHNSFCDGRTLEARNSLAWEEIHRSQNRNGLGQTKPGRMSTENRI